MKIKTLKSIYTLLKLGKKNYLPILECFLVDKDSISFSNLEIQITVKHLFPVRDGSQPFCVKADHFLQRIQNIKAPYFIDCDLNQTIKFQQPESDSTMKSEHVNDWPAHLICETERTELFTLSGHEISTLNIAAEFTADNELRPVMQQVCVDKYFTVASDAHKLYYKQGAPRQHDIEVLFDKKVIKLMMLFSGMSFKISYTTKNMNAEGEGVSIWWRKSDFNNNLPKNLFGDSVKSRYPNWRSVLPTTEHAVIIPLKEMIQGLDAIRFAVNGVSRLVICEIKGKKLELKGRDLDFDIMASEMVNIVNNEGNKIEIGLKYEFLRHILKTLLDEGYAQTTMEFNDPTRAVVFGKQILLMPMMINDGTKWD